MNRNAAGALLRDLRCQHVRIEARDDRLRVRAPKGTVSDRDREALRTWKPDILERLGQEEHLLGLSLDEFAKQDYSIELAVPWLEETIWFVPRADFINDLVRDGVCRGCIWTARELKDLSSIPSLTEQDLVALSRLKLAFGGEVLAVGDSAPSERPPSGPRGPVICRACTGSRYWVSIHGVVPYTTFGKIKKIMCTPLFCSARYQHCCVRLLGLHGRLHGLHIHQMQLVVICRAALTLQAESQRPCTPR